MTDSTRQEVYEKLVAMDKMLTELFQDMNKRFDGVDSRLDGLEKQLSSFESNIKLLNDAF